MAGDKQEWYYSVGGSSFGPVSWAELERLASAGKLSKTDMVRYATWSSWVPAGKPDLSLRDPLFPFATKQQLDYGYSLMAGGKYREAISWFGSLIDAAGIDAILAPDSDLSRSRVYLFQAAAYYLAGEYDNALRGFATADDGHHPASSYHKGFIYLCKKDYRSAVAQFKDALQRQDAGPGQWAASVGCRRIKSLNSSVRSQKPRWPSRGLNESVRLLRGQWLKKSLGVSPSG